MVVMCYKYSINVHWIKNFNITCIIGRKILWNRWGGAEWYVPNTRAGLGYMVYLVRLNLKLNS